MHGQPRPFLRPSSSSSLTAMFPYPNDLEMYDISSSLFPLSPSTLRQQDCLHDLLMLSPAGAAPAVPDLPGAARRRRSSGKDRHSKICTAQGPRDRRMRLSLDVARKFFDLQDLLGFDKASKTVQWLLTMSKSAINELVSSAKSDASSSQNEDAFSPSSAALAGDKVGGKSKFCGAVITRRPSPQSKVGRESREKARARARERTLEKKICNREHRSSKGKCQRSDPKSSCEFAAEMNLDQNRSSAFGELPRGDHNIGSTGSFNLCNYNLHNAVGNYLFQQAWENMGNMSFTSNSIDDRFLLGEI